MITTKSLIKWGGSLGITIPDDIVNAMNLKEGDVIEMNIKLINSKHLDSIYERVCNICNSINYVTKEDVENGVIDCNVCDNIIKLNILEK